MRIVQLEAEVRRVSAAAQTLLADTMRRCQEHVVTPATADHPAVTGRAMTAEEKGAIEALLAEARGYKAQLDRANGDAALAADINRLTEGLASQPQPDAPGPSNRPQSLGAQFVADESYRRFIQSGGHRRAGGWMSPAVDLHATTLTSDPASGGALIVPDVQPGIVTLNQRRVVVADLIAPGTTVSNLIQYMKEKTWTNAAAPVLEGAAKPESALVFAAATAPVQKIAHWIPVTEEMLEDYAQTASIIDARLRSGLSLTEEDQILNGTGIAPELLGFLSLTGLAATIAQGTDTLIDAIFKQMTAIAVTALVMPDGFVINPADWASIQLSKNTQGNYLGTGPWAAPQAPLLWGIPAAPTPAIAQGTVLVGGFRSSSQLFRRGGVRVEASNSHQDFFTKNLVAIRAEERLALAVYREGAFGKVTTAPIVP
jgi:HK97 family phage major capsid protein